MPAQVEVPISLTPNIAQLLWKGAVAHGHDIAIATRDADITYAALAGRAGAFAAALRARHIVAGDRVAIFLERGADAAAAFFGVVAAGGIAVIMSESLRPRQIEYICENAGARLLIAGADLLAQQPRIVAQGVPRLDPTDVAPSAPWEPVQRVSDDIAQLIYTSGSTGRPKGVTVTHGNLWAGVQSVCKYLQLESTDRIASLLPFSFDYGLNQLMCALWCGGTLVIETRRLPDDILAGLRYAQVSVIAAVPPIWLQLLTAPGFVSPLPSLRIMTSTGGRLPTDAVRRMRTLQPHARLYLMYGLTEAFRATYLSPEEVDAHPTSIGRAIPGTEIMVLREDGSACAPGEMGELVQRGPTVALGYWNDRRATDEVYRPNPGRPAGAPDAERVVFSGDLVRRDDDGRLYFIGRRDKLIKTLGHRVSPDDVAEALHASGEVAEAVITTEPDGWRGEQIVAVVRLASGGSLPRLRAFCRAELPRYMQPARYQIEAELPRVPNGKYDVAAISEQVAALARD